MTKHGEFNWNELLTSNANVAINFYKSSIGWTFQAEQMPSGGTYWLGLADGKPVCGLLSVERSKHEPADRWITYVHIDDINVAVNKISDLGGAILRPPWDVPGVGRIAMIRDPGGAELGWVTPV